MMVILKQTVMYLETEDRLQLLSQCSDDSVIALWLTRRLADRMVQAIFHGLDAAVPGSRAEGFCREGAVQEATAAADEAGLHRPVPADNPAPQHLVLSIDISPLPDGQQLIFHATGCDASFALGELPLLRWLGILQRLYLQAGWGTADVWPTWFEPEVSGRDLHVPEGTVLH